TLLAGGTTTFSTTGSLANARLKNSGTVDIGASTVGGNLAVTSTTGSITESGNISTGASGSSFTTSAAGQTINLASQTNNTITGTTSFSTNGTAGNVSFTNNVNGPTDLRSEERRGGIAANATGGGFPERGIINLDAMVQS